MPHSGPLGIEPAMLSPGTEGEVCKSQKVYKTSKVWDEPRTQQTPESYQIHKAGRQGYISNNTNSLGEETGKHSHHTVMALEDHVWLLGWTGMELFLWSMVGALSEVNRHLLTSP